MKTTVLATALVFFVALGTMSLGQESLESTKSDRVDLELTVYASGFGIVQDTRTLELPVGEGRVDIVDVASGIVPTTLYAESLNYPGSFTLLEQTYEYDLATTQALLDRFMGKKIKIVHWNEYQDRKEVLDAVLLATDGEEVIYQIGNEIYVSHPGYRVFPVTAEDLVTVPTLFWLYRNDIPTSQDLRISYLANNITWLTDYTLILDEPNGSTDLSCWVTLGNKSGASFENAKLKLVAGEPTHNQEARRDQVYMMKTLVPEGTPSFVESDLFEYHVYRLARRITLKNNQTRQLSFFRVPGIASWREYLVSGAPIYFTAPRSSQLEQLPVEVYIKFLNSEDSGLGLPLPAGTVRVYERDASGGLALVGEDTIPHTPRDELVNLMTGRAFDIVATRTQTDYQKIDTNLHESQWEITISNHKERGVTVGIVEPLVGSWQVLTSSQSFEKTDAWTIRFDVEIPANQERTVSYRVRVEL